MVRDRDAEPGQALTEIDLVFFILELISDFSTPVCGSNPVLIKQQIGWNQLKTRHFTFCSLDLF